MRRKTNVLVSFYTVVLHNSRTFYNKNVLYTSALLFQCVKWPACIASTTERESRQPIGIPKASNLVFLHLNSTQLTSVTPPTSICSIAMPTVIFAVSTWRNLFGVGTNGLLRFRVHVYITGVKFPAWWWTSFLSRFRFRGSSNL